ncbi:MAG: preprotein translocase subunit YajC [Phycisphaerae bacterium]
MIDLLTALAQTTTPPATRQPGAQDFFIPALFMGVMVFLVLNTITRSRREKRERAELQSSLTKHARVVTIGGIYGTIHSVKEDEVVIKVDESSNTKMTFLKSAVQKVLSNSPAGD